MNSICGGDDIFFDVIVPRMALQASLPPVSVQRADQEVSEIAQHILNRSEHRNISAALTPARTSLIGVPSSSTIADDIPEGSEVDATTNDTESVPIEGERKGSDLGSNAEVWSSEESTETFEDFVDSLTYTGIMSELHRMDVIIIALIGSEENEQTGLLTLVHVSIRRMRIFCRAHPHSNGQSYDTRSIEEPALTALGHPCR